MSRLEQAVVDNFSKDLINQDDLDFIQKSIDSRDFKDALNINHTKDFLALAVEFFKFTKGKVVIVKDKQTGKEVNRFDFWQ